MTTAPKRRERAASGVAPSVLGVIAQLARASADGPLASLVGRGDALMDAVARTANADTAEDAYERRVDARRDGQKRSRPDESGQQREVGHASAFRRVATPQWPVRFQRADYTNFFDGGQD